jgi:hypothetical protein
MNVIFGRLLPILSVPQKIDYSPSKNRSFDRHRSVEFHWACTHLHWASIDRRKPINVAGETIDVRQWSNGNMHLKRSRSMRCKPNGLDNMSVRINRKHINRMAWSEHEWHIKMSKRMVKFSPKGVNTKQSLILFVITQSMFLVRIRLFHFWPHIFIHWDHRLKIHWSQLTGRTANVLLAQPSEAILIWSAFQVARLVASRDGHITCSLPEPS